MKKSHPMVVFPIRQHVGQTSCTSTIPIVERHANQKLIAERHSGGFINETFCGRTKNWLFVRKEKPNKVFVVTEKNRNSVEQMSLPHARKKFVRIGHFTPLSFPTPSFRKRYTDRSSEVSISSGVWTRPNLEAIEIKRNLDPSRFFQTDFFYTASCDRGGRALLQDLTHVADARPFGTDRSQAFGSQRSNTDVRGSSSCTSQRATRTTCMKGCIPRSDSLRNSLNNSAASKKARGNR